uniref:NTF2 domain-containing protein n=1 Tax=Strongyloides papillosus TaxID=174720 RepID=A0A0N5CA03_STREA
MPPTLTPFTSYHSRHDFVEYSHQFLRIYVPEQQHVELIISALPEDIKEAVEDHQPEIDYECDNIRFTDVKHLAFIGCESIKKKLENSSQVPNSKLFISSEVSNDINLVLCYSVNLKLGYMRKISPYKVLSVSLIVVVIKRNAGILIYEDYARVNKCVIISEANDNISINNIFSTKKK